MIPHVEPPGHVEGAEGAGERAIPDTHNILVKILRNSEGPLKYIIIVKFLLNKFKNKFYILSR